MVLLRSIVNVTNGEETGRKCKNYKYMKRDHTLEQIVVFYKNTILRYIVDIWEHGDRESAKSKREDMIKIEKSEKNNSYVLMIGAYRALVLELSAILRSQMGGLTLKQKKLIKETHTLVTQKDYLNTMYYRGCTLAKNKNTPSMYTLGFVHVSSSDSMGQKDRAEDISNNTVYKAIISEYSGGGWKPVSISGLFHMGCLDIEHKSVTVSHLIQMTQDINKSLISNLGVSVTVTESVLPKAYIDWVNNKFSNSEYMYSFDRHSKGGYTSKLSVYPCGSYEHFAAQINKSSEKRTPTLRVGAVELVDTTLRFKYTQEPRRRIVLFTCHVDSDKGDKNRITQIFDVETYLDMTISPIDGTIKNSRRIDTANIINSDTRMGHASVEYTRRPMHLSIDEDEDFTNVSEESELPLNGGDAALTFMQRINQVSDNGTGYMDSTDLVDGVDIVANIIDSKMDMDAYDGGTDSDSDTDIVISLESLQLSDGIMNNGGIAIDSNGASVITVGKKRRKMKSDATTTKSPPKKIKGSGRFSGSGSGSGGGGGYSGAVSVSPDDDDSPRTPPSMRTTQISTRITPPPLDTPETNASGLEQTTISSSSSSSSSSSTSTPPVSKKRTRYTFEEEDEDPSMFMERGKTIVRRLLDDSEESSVDSDDELHDFIFTSELDSPPLGSDIELLTSSPQRQRVMINEEPQREHSASSSSNYIYAQIPIVSSRLSEFFEKGKDEATVFDRFLERFQPNAADVVTATQRRKHVVLNLVHEKDVNWDKIHVKQIYEVLVHGLAGVGENELLTRMKFEHCRQYPEEYENQQDRFNKKGKKGKGRGGSGNQAIYSLLKFDTLIKSVDEAYKEGAIGTFVPYLLKSEIPLYDPRYKDVLTNMIKQWVGLKRVLTNVYDSKNICSLERSAVGDAWVKIRSDIGLGIISRDDDDEDEDVELKRKLDLFYPESHPIILIEAQRIKDADPMNLLKEKRIMKKIQMAHDEGVQKRLDITKEGESMWQSGRLELTDRHTFTTSIVNSRFEMPTFINQSISTYFDNLVWAIIHSYATFNMVVSAYWTTEKQPNISNEDQWLDPKNGYIRIKIFGVTVAHVIDSDDNDYVEEVEDEVIEYLNIVIYRSYRSEFNPYEYALYLQKKLKKK